MSASRLPTRFVLAWAILVGVSSGMVGGAPGRVLFHLALMAPAVLAAQVAADRSAARTWRHFGAGVATLCAAEALFTVVDLKQLGDPILASAPIYVLGYALLLSGVVSFLRGRPPAEYREGAIDSAILLLPVLAVTIWLMVGAVADGRDATVLALIAVKPLADALLEVVVALLVLARGRHVRATGLLLLGVFALLVTDGVWAWWYGDPNPTGAHWASTGYPLAFAILALAASTGTRDVPAGTSRFAWIRDHASILVRVYLLGAAVVIFPLAAVLDLKHDDNGSLLVAAASFVTAVAVVVRVTQLYRRIERANDELRGTRDELAEHARRDPLTGLLNRTAIDDALGDAEAEPERRCVLSIDLDGFKAVNDAHGHAAGDEVLRVVAQRLESRLRPIDTVIRVGGDEFIVVCHDLNQLDAERVALDLRADIQAPIRWHDGIVEVSASIGVVAVDAVAVDVDDLLSRADAAMYAAKRAGGGVRFGAGAPRLQQAGRRR